MSSKGVGEAHDFLGLPGVITLDKQTRTDALGREYLYCIAETTDPVVYHPCDPKLRRVHDRRRYEVADEPRGRTPVRIEFRRRAYKCLACEAQGKRVLFKEQLPHLARGKRQTERLFQYLVVESSDTTFRRTARKAKLSDRNVGGVFHRVMDRYQGRIEPAPRVLGIDEKKLCGRKRGIICDIGQRRLLAVTDDDLDAFKEYIRLMPGRERTEIVVTDMRGGFITLACEMFRKATVVVDKFHVLQRGNIALSRFITAVRRRKDFRRVEDKRLLFGAARLLSQHWQDMKPHEAVRASEIFKAYPEIGEAYHCKEDFYCFYACDNPKDAIKAYRQWELDVPTASRRFFREHTFLRPGVQRFIFAYFNARRTNAFTENRNRRLADIFRDGRALTLDTIMQKAMFDEKRVNLSSDPLQLLDDVDNTPIIFYFNGHGSAQNNHFFVANENDANHPLVRQWLRKERFQRRRREARGDPPKLIILDACQSA